MFFKNLKSVKRLIYRIKNDYIVLGHVSILNVSVFQMIKKVSN